MELQLLEFQGLDWALTAKAKTPNSGLKQGQARLSPEMHNSLRLHGKCNGISIFQKAPLVFCQFTDFFF